MASRSELSASSIEYSLLGLLGKRPMHGYELHRELSRETGLGLIWKVKQAQLYAILSKLEADGLIAAERMQQGKRPARRVFHLTETGRSAFEAWLRQPSGRRSFRLDFLAKLFFSRQGEGGSARALFAEQRRLCERWIAEMRDRSAGCEGGELDELVYRFRIGQLESMLAWIDQCSEAIAAPGRGVS